MLEETPAAATKEELLVHVYAVERAPGIVLARLKAPWHSVRGESTGTEEAAERYGSVRAGPVRCVVDARCSVIPRECRSRVVQAERWRRFGGRG